MLFGVVFATMEVLYIVSVMVTFYGEELEGGLRESREYRTVSLV